MCECVRKFFIVVSFSTLLEQFVLKFISVKQLLNDPLYKTLRKILTKVATFCAHDFYVFMLSTTFNLWTSRLLGFNFPGIGLCKYRRLAFPPHHSLMKNGPIITNLFQDSRRTLVGPGS